MFGESHLDATTTLAGFAKGNDNLLRHNIDFIIYKVYCFYICK